MVGPMSLLHVVICAVCVVPVVLGAAPTSAAQGRERLRACVEMTVRRDRGITFEVFTEGAHRSIVPVPIDGLTIRTAGDRRTIWSIQVDGAVSEAYRIEYGIVPAEFWQVEPPGVAREAPPLREGQRYEVFISSIAPAIREFSYGGETAQESCRTRH
jgi:hypothetical protein